MDLAVELDSFVSNFYVRRPRRDGLIVSETFKITMGCLYNMPAVIAPATI